MTRIPRRFFDFDEYLEREAATHFKYEFLRGEIHAMLGTGLSHNRVTCNSLIALSKLRNTEYETFFSNQRLLVEKIPFATYPDLVVFRDGLFVGRDERNLVNPTVLIEVATDESREYDLGLKFELYKELDSLREYLVIDSEKPWAWLHTRRDDDSWSMREEIGLDASFHLASVDAELKMGDIYEHVEFEVQPIRYTLE